MKQVIMNLAVNARDAMPGGGRLVIEAKNVHLATDKRVHSLAAGSYTVNSVSDSGHVMDAETLSHIFEPFFTTKEAGKGTGLGPIYVLRDYRAERWQPEIDLLLTDVVMPGMNGPELIDQVRKSRPDSTVLFLSGYDRGLDRGTDARPGCCLPAEAFYAKSAAR